MLQLPHGCSCSDPSVFPRNWLQGGTVLLKSDWRIQYYFIDPDFREKYKYGKLVVVKGMNAFKSVAERRQVTRQLLANELRMLKEEGYNPITKTYNPPVPVGEINPDTLFVNALNKALDRLTINHRTMIDMKSAISGVSKASRRIGVFNTPIGSMSRKHFKQILDECKLYNTRYNAYSGYLMMLFKE